MTATADTLIPKYTDEFIRIYRDGLLEDIIPFWIRHSVDREYGGYLTSLDRDGTVIDTDKAVWLQGRFAWMLSTLYNTVGQYGVEPRPEWLELAKHGIDFLDAHCFDDDGAHVLPGHPRGQAAAQAALHLQRDLHHHRLRRLRPGHGRRRPAAAGRRPLRADPALSRPRPACCRPRPTRTRAP